MIPKLNFLSFAAALSLFLLPWLDLQCSQKSKVTQTGLQTITGQVALSDGIIEQAGAEKEHQSDQEKLEPALFVSVGFGCIGLGVILSFAGMWRKGAPSIILPCLAATALILMALQMLLGFPLEDKAKNSLTPKDADRREADFDIAEALDILEMRVVYRPWVYAELGLLALPLALAYFGLKTDYEDEV